MSAYDHFNIYMETAVNWENLSSELREGSGLTTATLGFADGFVEACLSRVRELPPKHVVFRARIMPLDRALDTEPLPLEEMGPPPASTIPGRLNAPADGVFYGAFEPDTALAEVRPWPSARITVATFETIEATKCVDLVDDEGWEDTRTVMRHWARFIFSRPVYPTDRHAYLGTQYISQRIRSAGVAGIIYQSRLRVNGTNVALFRSQDVTPKSAVLHEISSVSYSAAVLAPAEARPPRSYAAIGRLIRGLKA